MKKMKKIIMVVVMVLLSVTLLNMISCEVKATTITLNDLEISGGSTVDQNAVTANQIAANQIAANKQATNSQIIQPTSNTHSNGVGNTLPKTGITEDITVMFFIIVCVISAIYAYKKIRDYKA